MLNKLVVPAQLQIGVNLFCPTDNAIYEITNVQGDSLHPDVTMKRCLYNETLCQVPIVVNYDNMAYNYMPISANS